jgi:hypothetical protein
LTRIAFLGQSTRLQVVVDLMAEAISHRLTLPVGHNNGSGACVRLLGNSLSNGWRGDAV